MAPEDPARGARGGAHRARGSRPRRGNSARGGRGGAAAAAPSNENATPDVEMGDATAAQAAPEASTDVPIKSEGDAAGAPSNPPPAGTTPSSSATRPAAARPAPTRGGASGAAKFLPRAIRRSQLDREAIAQKESQKQEDKAAQDARLRRAGRGGRGGGRRARGGPGGFQDRVIKGGAGGFASQLESTGSRGGSSGGFGKLYDYGSAGGSGGGGGGGGGGGSGGWSVGVKSEGGPKAFSSESSRPTGRRMNTDKIVEYVVIEDNDEQVKSKEGTPVLLPKGMQREDPKEPEGPEIATAEEVEAADRGETVIQISSGGSEEDDEDVFFNDADVEMGDDGRQWPGAKPDRRVKVEGEEVTEIDTLTKKKAAKKAEQKAKKLQTKYKDPEDQLAADTLAFQRRLFGVESDDESDAEAPDTAEAKVPRKPAIIDGNLYLFQFPPVLPPLHIAEKTQKSQGPVKDEPTDDVVMLDAPAHKESKPVDLTAADDSTAVKKEEGAADAENARRAEEQPEGFLGKLIVRRSGKMQIDYGGFLFDCESGIPVEFLRTAVLTEMDDEKKPDGYAGTAYGMGQISGKFVSVPKWSDEEEWVVDPSELPPNGAASG